MERVHIRLIPLPPAVRAVTVTDPEGDFNVYLNRDLPAPVREQALQHELQHIKKQHFYSGAPVEQCELEAEEKIF